ncbi:hypothetical protein Bca52824_021703 [Brassica carinata]|uniref:F-box domain-containing protein n=1 Tax=Brassica carinata TaxID=52824 RepID=A0A8X7VF87_BRACI|nr:hypothetical protein Bca52824_021703 [Brassica carinata]
MRTGRQKLSADRETVVGKNSLPIPTDFIYDILLRLSPKYIARCRCVSKLWASILDREVFTDQFLKQSSTRPQLLFACTKDGKVSFFSSAQPQNPDENSSPLTANYHMSLPFDHAFKISSSVSGLVCMGDVRRLNGMKTKVMVSVICNPSTGQSFTLPRMNTRNKMGGIRSFFGHDPVEKQFKVLSMTWSHCNPICEEHQVLTLETGKLSWRMIKCNVSHYPEFDHGCNSVCINGVLYYKAKPNVYSSSEEVMIICFDVRFEKFSFIKATKPFMGATLMNYKGKLASLTPGGSYFFGRENTSFEMRVLDDREKEEWSKHSYKLPPQWQTAVTNSNIIFVGVTGSNEIVFSGHSPSNHPFYVFYYSLEKGTIRRVEFQGIGEFQKSRPF